MKKIIFLGVIALGSITYGSPYLAHRFSFNGDFTDSAGDIDAPKGAIGYEFVECGSGKAVKLSGGAKGSSYVDLGENVIPVDGMSATVELWVTLNKKSSYARIFETGFNNSNGYLTGMAWQRSDDNTDFIFVYHGGNNKSSITDRFSPYMTGVQYHLAMVFTPCDNGTWTVRAYKQDAVTGATLAKAAFTAPSSWTLQNQFQKYFYLGHTFASGDDDAAATYDELRIWRRALSEAELSESAKLGPDAQITADSFPFGVKTFDTAKALSVGASNVSTIGGIDKLGTGILKLSGDNKAEDGMRIYDGIVRQMGGELTVSNAAVNVGAYDEKSSAEFAASDGARLNIHSVSGNPSETDGRRSLAVMDNVTIRPLSADLNNFEAKLTHRWSFNGDASDSVGGQTAGLTNCVCAADGKTITLPGGSWGSSYIDLGANILPKDADAATIEIWATQDSAAAGASIFDIGINQWYFAGMRWNLRGVVGSDYIEIKHEGTSKSAQNKLQPYSIGTQYHIAITYYRDSDNNWHATAYKQDAATGETLAKTTFDAPEGWSLATMYQTYCYLGHCIVLGSSDAAATYNEVRVWRGMLTEEELTASAKLGPDAPTVFLGGMTAVDIGGDGVTIDTDGKDVTVASPIISSTSQTKLFHRWSFNGDAADSIGGQTAGLTNCVCDANGQTVTLSGGAWGNSYVDLGRDVLPKDAEAATVEIWARPNEFSKYARVFDFGINKYYVSGLYWFRDYADRDYVEVKHNNCSSNAIDKLGSYSIGTEYHLAVVYFKDTDETWKVTAYKQDAITGKTLKKTTFNAPEGWSLATMYQDYCYLGHSVVSGAYDASATYNEIRIWRGALSEAALSRNAVMGPDAQFGNDGEPALKKVGAGTLTLEGTKVAPRHITVKGGVLNVASADVLPRDAVISMVLDDKAGQGLLSCAKGVLDLSGMTLEVVGIKEASAKIMTSEEGFGGRFELKRLPSGYSVEISDNAVNIVYHGMVIVVR